MTDNNNKFVPQAQTTYEVKYVENQQKPKLSPAARAKVVNRSGSNYLSPWANTDISEAVGYGPCLEKSCNFSITATLVDRYGNSRTESLVPTSLQEIEDLENRIRFATGQWRGDWNDGFSPSIGRDVLAGEVRWAASYHGPRRITVVENPERKDVSITINGNRVR